MPAPKYLEKPLGWLLPPACREHVLGDLQERYKSPKSYLVDALPVLPPVIVSRIRRTTDFQGFLIQTFSVYLSFTTTAWYLARQGFLYEHAGFARLAVPTIVAGVALLFCNAYSDPERRYLSKPILQGAGSISLAFLLQAVIFDTQGSFAVPFWIMLYGSFSSVLLLSTLRMLFPPVLNRPKLAPLNLRRPLQSRERDKVSKIQDGPKYNLLFAIAAALVSAALLLALIWHAA